MAEWLESVTRDQRKKGVTVDQGGFILVNSEIDFDGYLEQTGLLLVSKQNS